MDERELTDVEWEQEIKTAVVEFRRALWAERKKDRAEREQNPWLL